MNLQKIKQAFRYENLKRAVVYFLVTIGFLTLVLLLWAAGTLFLSYWNQPHSTVELKPEEKQELVETGKVFYRFRLGESNCLNKKMGVFIAAVYHDSVKVNNVSNGLRRRDHKLPADYDVEESFEIDNFVLFNGDGNKRMLFPTLMCLKDDKIFTISGTPYLFFIGNTAKNKTTDNFYLFSSCMDKPIEIGIKGLRAISVAKINNLEGINDNTTPFNCLWLEFQPLHTKGSANENNEQTKELYIYNIQTNKLSPILDKSTKAGIRKMLDASALN